MDKRLELTTETLLAAIDKKSNSKRLLDNGLLIRRGFQEQLSKGQIPDHPRFEWLRRNARAILEHLLKVSKDYQAEGDRASMVDLLDISSMTMNHVSDIIKLGYMDPEKVNLLPYEKVQGSFEPKTEESAPPLDVPTEAVEEDEEESEESPDLELLTALANKKS